MKDDSTSSSERGLHRCNRRVADRSTIVSVSELPWRSLACFAFVLALKIYTKREL